MDRNQADGLALAGVHHVTAICGDPQSNLDFYSGLLGLRLVKKTVNFDDPGSYHLYYGDAVGTPGTLITFFAWTGLPPMVDARGRTGAGQIAAASFGVSDGALEYWIDRFAASGVDFDGPTDRFGDRVIRLEDPDGMPVELVEGARGPQTEYWSSSNVPEPSSIRGVAGVTLCLTSHHRTASMLTGILGFRAAGSEGDRFRFELGTDEPSILDIVVRPEAAPGRMGLGAIHHVAWRTPSATGQVRWRDLLRSAGADATGVLDRQYFESIYFHEPGGILFEIATDPPGFMVDEARDELGRHLKLPPWLESRRAAIAARLQDLHLPAQRNE